MTAWERVRDRITARDARGLADLVIALSGPERTEVARRLPDLRAELREAADRRRAELWSSGLGEEDEWDGGWDEEGDGPGPWDEEGDDVDGHGEALRIAGAGVLAGPAATVAWLTRREFTGRRPARVEEVIRVLTARPAGWQAEVAVRLAGKVRAAGDRDTAPLALALLRACGAPPPEHDPLVIAWLRTRPAAGDPLIGPLLPRIFEAEGAGRVLREERLEPVPTPWLSLLRRLQATGRVSRAELLDGCLRRFLRGGDAMDLRFFVRLHRMLDPTPQEAAARVRDYLRLLPATPGTVAELALAQVRHGGPHEEAEIIEAIGALAFRPEAKLALEGLRWLERELPYAAELAPALAAAFGHASYEVQGRAARIALKHAAAFAPGGQAVAEAVPMLPPALGARVAAVYGGEVAAQERHEVFTPPPLPAPSEPEPFPEPTLHLPWNMYQWPDYERWLAAFVRQAAGDREGMRRTLAPDYGGDNSYLFQRESWVDTRSWFTALAQEVLAPGTDPGPAEPEPFDPWAGASFQVRVRLAPDTEDEEEDAEQEEQGEPERAFGRWPEHVREEIFEQLLGIGVSKERVAAMRDGLRVPPPAPGEPRGFRIGIAYAGSRPPFMKPAPPDPAVESRRARRLPQPSQVSPPHLFVLHRLSEVYVALRAGTLPPVLLATPTLTTGHLDPDVLVDRLAECAAAGAEPLPADLAQALLRVPRGRHPDAAGRAAHVCSPAAATAAAWLAGEGLPDPDTGLRWGYLEGASDRYFDEHEPDHRPWEIRLVPRLRAEPTGHDLLDELLREPSRWSWDDHGAETGWWPAVLPSHREVVAVNYLPFLLHPTIASVFVRALADADGPTGEAMALTLAYFVAAGHPEAPPLLLRMAARGDLPAEAVGEQVALLLRRTPRFEERAVVRVLTEAARQGAYAAVWRLLTTLLPTLLPGPGERPAVVHTEAMALAADTATWAAARGAIPQVTAYAASGGRSRFVRECARLRDQLG
ncbi:hypothetical protein [Nonomuraea jiangxiensis]|uniref:Uncharacterized protein n=1 Tax=Nonomuraea jiangxiensis TaxID=633440 RepID=A0A1G9ND15_9ACTN|nr:hypothetical protein [Nonomuraea jiangxiensis]SDL84007.1 hypothetical protein SAMN05421869_131100 [Nonomuraea jiangxiensis]